MQRNPGKTSDRRQHQALDQHLPDEPRAPRAQGRADGHFAHASGGPGEQEAGGIGAGDHQHQDKDSKKKSGEGFDVAAIRARHQGCGIKQGV